MKRACRLLFAAVIVAALLSHPLHAASGPSEGTIVFSGERVRIQYQSPLRLGDGSSLSRDVARMNLLVNFADHYLAALIRMNYIASNTEFTLDYSPNRNTAFQPGPNRIQLPDLGGNGFLMALNAALKRKAGTVSSRLIDDVRSLLTMRDHLPRRTDTIEADLGFSCLSNGLTELYPDLDFEPVASAAVVAVRPDEVANHLVLLADASGSILLPHSHKPYGFPRASADGRWLSFTENGVLKLLDLQTPQAPPLNLFEDPQLQLLDMEWAPTGPVLAGIVLHRGSLERRLFVFDAAAGKHVEQVVRQTEIDGNYQFAYPFWAPDGKKLFFVTDHVVNLIDLAGNRTIPRLVTLQGQLSEIVWSPDARAFALVEIVGQTRDKQEFDDRDFTCSILRRYDLNDLGQAVELPEQQHTSSDTIKLVSFWSKNRVLYLEGHLRSPRVSSPLWNLASTFAARLTPAPGDRTGSGAPEAGAIDLALAYCYAYKTMDSKFRPLYDTGMAQGNHQFMDRFETRWFLGLSLPSGYPTRVGTFCLRRSPYPFPERNIVCFTGLSAADAKSLLEFLEAYNIRRFELSQEFAQILFLSNTRGPMSLWRGRTTGIGEVKPPRSADGNEDDMEEAPPEPDTASGTGAIATSTPPTGAALAIPDLPSE
ncbi:MAG TPA: hypothetical protein PLP29_18000 [Candidatus Ozemobacteraceae bacterium]|nr:hypothetical protein [Candidatus Ozemobacteraceae bacterium]